jgi:hypothetical protein
MIDKDGPAGVVLSLQEDHRYLQVAMVRPYHIEYVALARGEGRALEIQPGDVISIPIGNFHEPGSWALLPLDTR